jgi:hypothetical protein
VGRAFLEPDFEVTVRVVVQVVLQLPEVSIDGRIRTRTQQYELRAVGQGAEEGVLDEMGAFLAVDAAHEGDDWLVFIPQRQPVAQGILVRIFPPYRAGRVVRWDQDIDLRVQTL